MRPVSRETCVRLADSFSYTEIGENPVENVLDIDAAGQSAERGRRLAQILGAQFQRGEVAVEEAVERGGAALQLAAVAGAGDGRAFADVGGVADLLSQPGDEAVKPRAGLDGERQCIDRCGRRRRDRSY